MRRWLLVSIVCVFLAGCGRDEAPRAASAERVRRLEHERELLRAERTQLMENEVRLKKEIGALQQDLARERLARLSLRRKLEGTSTGAELVIASERKAVDREKEKGKVLKDRLADEARSRRNAEVDQQKLATALNKAKAFEATLKTRITVLEGPREPILRHAPDDPRQAEGVFMGADSRIRRCNRMADKESH